MKKSTKPETLYYRGPILGKELTHEQLLARLEPKLTHYDKLAILTLVIAQFEDLKEFGLTWTVCDIFSGLVPTTKADPAIWFMDLWEEYSKLWEIINDY